MFYLPVNLPEVIYQSELLTALLYRTAKNQALVVYRSIIIRVDDRAYRPVAELLAKYCNFAYHHVERADVMMPGRRSVNTAHLLLADCPGTDVDHDCVSPLDAIPEQPAEGEGGTWARERAS